VTPDTLFVFLLLGTAVVLFVHGKIRYDIVALLVVIALMFAGILDEREALSGFASPIVILVAGLLVIGEMLTSTGVANALGGWISKVGGSSETRLFILLMVAATTLSAVMSSTAVVAIFIPVVIDLGRRTDINASRLLLPMSYAALVGGMTTLIATTPNLVVSDELSRSGFEPFDFYSFTPIGLVVMVVLIVYTLTIGRTWLPSSESVTDSEGSSSLRRLLDQFHLSRVARRFKVKPGSPMIGVTLANNEELKRLGVRILAIERGLGLRDIRTFMPTANSIIHQNDVLIVHVSAAGADELVRTSGLEELSVDDDQRARWARDVGFASVMIHPESALVGKTIKDSLFRTRGGVQVLAIKRRGELVQDFADEPLKVADTLLVMGGWKNIQLLSGQTHDFVVVTLPKELESFAPARPKAPIAVVILLIMVVMLAGGWLPMTATVLICVLAAVFTGCITMDGAYRAIHWPSLILIAGMLPIADALSKTGGVDLIVDGLTSGLGGFGPYAMTGVLFAVTAVLSMTMSNTATAVLMAPIALALASAAGVSPYPFAMTIAIAASSGFATPFSSPVVTLVVGPGNYSFVGHSSPFS
jgi:di/tricarboxylate transporter